MPILAILFIVVPLAELALIITVGRTIGVLETIGLLFLTSILGAWLAKREGVGVYRRIRAEMDAGKVPASELLDAALILAGGILLLTPGFITDIVAVALLVPPGRRVVRGIARQVIVGRFAVLRVADNAGRVHRVWTATRRGGTGTARPVQPEPTVVSEPAVLPEPPVPPDA